MLFHSFFHFSVWHLNYHMSHSSKSLALNVYIINQAVQHIISEENMPTPSNHTFQI